MEQRLKMVVPNSLFYSGELGEYMWSKIMVLVTEMADREGVILFSNHPTDSYSRHRTRTGYKFGKYVVLFPHSSR
jgi:hypothetical protein